MDFSEEFKKDQNYINEVRAFTKGQGTLSLSMNGYQLCHNQQEIIDAVKPERTRFCVETMPWMIPSSPDEYLQLLRDVDRTEFGVHLDVVNMITSPERYFFNDRFLDECFRKLGGRILSCHLKDIRLKEEYTFQLEECACGEGSLDLKRYIDLASAEDPHMPMIIEHLGSDCEYVRSVKYVIAL